MSGRDYQAVVYDPQQLGALCAATSRGTGVSILSMAHLRGLCFNNFNPIRFYVVIAFPLNTSWAIIWFHPKVN